MRSDADKTRPSSADAVLLDATIESLDGEAMVAGWEPGGCAEAECEATDPDKSMFFNDATAGAKLGMWVLTIHNYNIVPLRSGRYVAVSGPTRPAPEPLAELNTGSHAETAWGSGDDDRSSTLALVLGAQGSRPPGPLP